jgi:release factor glutamine methyltransferase
VSARPEDPLSISRALATAKSHGVDRLDAQLMLAALLDRPRSWLIAHDDASLDQAQESAFEQWLTRRRDGEPLAYLLGEKEFHGLKLQVDPSVLVPRPETELLVDWGLRVLQGGPLKAAELRVIDLGTGSGAIALSIKHDCQAAAVTAVDASPTALAIAGRNSQSLNLPITLAPGNWWQAVPGQRFDLALANPPYIAPGDEHLEALRHEPQAALMAQDNGLADLECIIAGAPGHLAPGGWLLLEHGHDQATWVRQRLAGAGFTQVQTLRDLAGIERCTGGRALPATTSAFRVVFPAV